MEDKVIGPLTLVQFFYLLFGGLFIYLLNNWTAGTFLRPLYWLIAIPVGLLSFALAFVKVQDRPFIYFLGSLVHYLQRPKKRVWQKGQYQRSTQIVQGQEAPEEAAPHKEFDRARVQDIVGILDKPIDEAQGRPEGGENQDV